MGHSVITIRLITSELSAKLKRMTSVQIKFTEFSDLITCYTANLVGREWLAKQMDTLLDDPACRFIVFTGQLATLYPHLFYPENPEVVVCRRIGSVKAEGEAMAVRIRVKRPSP